MKLEERGEEISEQQDMGQIDIVQSTDKADGQAN